MEDDNISKGSSDETNLSRSFAKGDEEEEDERDEVKEIRKMAAKETSRVRFWRFIVTGLLIATALIVTLTTFKALEAEETQRFERAFRQFSVTIANSARNQQIGIRLSHANAAEIISSSAYVNNATWPYYTFPRYEQLAYNAIYQSRSEVLFIAHLVKNASRDQWLTFAENNYNAWMDEGYMIESKREGPQVYDNLEKVGYNPFLTKVVANGTGIALIKQEEEKAEYWVGWSYSPPPVTYQMVNLDVTSVPEYDSIIQTAIKMKDQTLLTRVKKFVSADIAFTKAEHQAMHSPKLANVILQLPHSVIFHPVHIDPDDVNSEIVAVLIGGMAWDAALLDVLPDDATGIDVVLANDCNQSYTFRVNGQDAIYVGEGDLHDTNYDYLQLKVDLDVNVDRNDSISEGHCVYQMDIYPTAMLEDTWDSNDAEVFAIAIASTFALVIATFYVYDLFVQRRNEKLIINAAKSSAIVSSLFPGNIRDKLMDQGIAAKPESPDKMHAFMNGKHEGSEGGSSSAPMADLFLETTIMFADIVGFTAWSSVREPSQVFLLLETLYSGFDEIAKTRHVFKVETVGDCYVAATGMPHPRKDHAICMCRFARDVLKKMNVLTKKLEVTLGPETGELNLRTGIHSGPITAGILRGEKARFQLFGDTMNTTARMESTGMPGRIQLSQETADILVRSGKSHWIEKRAEMVQAKGKGRMQTYWLKLAFDQHDASVSSGSSNTDPEDEVMELSNIDCSKTRRLIDWNVSSLLRILKHIVAVRDATGKVATDANRQRTLDLERRILESGLSCLDEVQEIITLPEFNERTPDLNDVIDDVYISPLVIEQLTDYVACIASMYRANSFHNFEHASHVGMSVLKLLVRIVARTESDHVDKSAADLHDHTYGITSDPLTQFACAFAAIIHDVDHAGVPNTQLVLEQTPVAVAYNNRSVAEQNSLALAWCLLMDDRFSELRKVIYMDAVELARFRQLVVNAVMATDIADKDLKALRNARWEKAFDGKDEHELHPRDAINRKATIVIEHLIQASDIAHTMQHWHIYRKWNEYFFRECYAAYMNGRAATDPSESWYRGEIGFFDFYIIPLAKKLKDCGVFGKASDEYLSYAMKNREEWEIRGMEIVAEMREKAVQQYGERIFL